MRVCFVIFFLSFISIGISAQQLKDAAQYSAVFLFKISDQDAARVVATNGWGVDERMLSNPVHSEHSVSELLRYQDSLLAFGHYIKSQVAAEHVKYQLISVLPFRIEVVENNTDLAVQVFGGDNAIINDAKLWVKKKQLKFDSKTQSYRSRKSFKEEILNVEHEDFTAYFNLENTVESRKWKPGNILLRRPVRWLYLPIRYVVRLPIDGLKSIDKGQAIGVIGSTKYFFNRQGQKIGRLFDGVKEAEPTSDYGYAVLSKPKYKPRDTVRFKAFVTNRKGKPLTKDLDLYFSGYNRRKVCSLSPYAPGAYSYEFVLHDSLNLKLDRRYYVSLRSRNNYFQSTQFHLEEYELQKLSIKAEADEETQYYGVPYSIKVKASDENDFPILDGRLKLKVTSSSPANFRKDTLYVPYTLLEHEMPLLPEEEMLIELPDSIFPAANLNYKVDIELLTSDNESKKTHFVGRYRWAKEVIDIELLKDSLIVFADHTSATAAVQAKLDILTIDESRSEYHTLPCTLKIDPRVYALNVDTELSDQRFNLSSEKDKLQIIPNRSRDSIKVQVSNPRNIPFSYYLYEGNTEMSRGFGKTLNLSYKANRKKHYLISVQYLWAGNIKTKHFNIPFDEDQLTVDISHPEMIYPGQETELLVQAENTKGEPVEGLDLTAMGLTNKFDYGPPSPKRWKRKNRKKKKALANNYTQALSQPVWSRNIDYAFWDAKADIGQMAYYQFLFPKDDFFISTEPTSDSITQFAPFVVSGGRIQAIHVIYVDNLPVYFSWSTNERPYSFAITPGKHDIKLRTSHSLISLTDVDFPEAQKTIFSVTEAPKGKGKMITKRTPELTDREVAILYPYIMAYWPLGRRTFSYLKHGSQISLLNRHHYGSSHHNLLGPVYGRNVKFVMHEAYETDFVFERNFQYEFAPNLLKMRYAENRVEQFGFPKQLNDAPNRQFGQEVFTQEKLEKRIAIYAKKQLRERMQSGSIYSLGGEKGDLQLDLSLLGKQDSLISILFFTNNNTVLSGARRGGERVIKGLDDGYLNVMLLYEGDKYRWFDSLLITAHGLNFYKLPEMELKSYDSLGQTVQKIIQNLRDHGDGRLSLKDFNEIRNTTGFSDLQPALGHTLIGKVTDVITGEELIGANIVVKQGDHVVNGTVSDFDGNFRLGVGAGTYDLSISYVGYADQMITDVIVHGGGVTYLPVALGESVLLNEVVVVGYGVPRIKRDYATSGAVVRSERIRNLPVKNISALAATTAGITWSETNNDIVIRGSRADGTDYYIDGIRIRGDSKIPQSEINEVKIIDGKEAQTVYGVDKVVLITTKKAQLFSPEFYAASKNASGIRDNFSDEAFWAPRLTTDANGQVRVPITFPDDITKWDVHVFAMGKKGRAGTASGSVRAMKPLSGQLSLPRFLLTGDSTVVLGRSFSYSEDTLQLKSTFSVNDNTISTKKIQTHKSTIEKFDLSSTKLDSLNVQYEIEKADGYLDGEKRSIPVLPVGLEYETGNFMLFHGDTTYSLSQEFSSDAPVTIHAQLSRRQYVRRQLRRVHDYSYLCNEQLASKLLAFLREKEFATLEGEVFKYEKDVNDIIRLLLKGRNQKRLWGWWVGNEYSPWISQHVCRALLRAHKHGFDVGLEPMDLAAKLTYELQATDQPAKILYTLQALLAFDLAVDHLRYFEQLDTLPLNFYQSLQLLTLKQQANLPVDRQLVLDNLEADIFGNLHVNPPNETTHKYRVHGNKLHTSLLGYSLLKSDTLNDHSEVLLKMRNYFFANQINGYWRNTYDASLIVEAIWSDIMTVAEADYRKPTLTLSGAVDTAIVDFPYTATMDQLHDLQLNYQGNVPVYISVHQSHWTDAVTYRANDLEVNSKFLNHSDDNMSLKAGESATLQVELDVKKDADYIMIEVPIPAGCTYASKRKRYGQEVHREYFKDKVAIFCKKLTKGKYSFDIELMSRFEGTYTLNPAKACLMYFPTFYANSEIKKVTIQAD